MKPKKTPKPISVQTFIQPDIRFGRKSPAWFKHSDTTVAEPTFVH